MRQESKLPKWAQQRLNNLRMKITELEDALRKARGVERSKIVVNPYADEPGYLQDDTVVHFKLSMDEDKWFEYIEVRATENGAQIRTGTTYLKVLPRSVNMIEIETDGL